MQGKTVSMSGHRKLASCGYATKWHEKWHLPAVKKLWRTDKSEKLSKFVIKTFCSRDSNFVCLKQTRIIENVQGLRQYQANWGSFINHFRGGISFVLKCVANVFIYVLVYFRHFMRPRSHANKWKMLPCTVIISSDKILSYMEDQSGPEIPSSSSFCRTLHPFPAKDFESFYWFVRSSLRSALQLVRFVC